MYQNITSINERAYKVFKLLADYARKGKGGAVEIKRASEFMPLYVAIIQTVSDAEEWVSLAHYGEEQGDLMRDPEMMFYHDRKEGKAYAMTFRDDYAGTWEDSIKPDTDGRPWKVSPARQKHHTAFAEVWLKNIKSQQNIKEYMDYGIF